LLKRRNALTISFEFNGLIPSRRSAAWRMRRASNPSKGSDALRRDGINPLNSKEIVRALHRLSKPFC
jgi:hypothetical protein